MELSALLPCDCYAWPFVWRGHEHCENALCWLERKGSSKAPQQWQGLGVTMVLQACEMNWVAVLVVLHSGTKCAHGWLGPNRWVP